MALRRGAQLDDVHRLARVHVHVEPDAVGHRDGVRGGVAQAARRRSCIVQLRRRVHHRAPVVERAGLFDRRRLGVAVARR